jgi:hypothetical protein
MLIGLHVNRPSLFSDFNETLILLMNFSKNPEILNFMKIRLVGADFFPSGRTVGQT